MQSKIRSVTESCVNIIVGYSINLVAQLVIFPLFDINIPIKSNLCIGALFTIISLVRSYLIRRWFTKGDSK